MAEQANRDQNHVTSVLFTGSDGGTYNLEGDENTGRIYVDLASGSGTVTSVSVVTANGFAGSVANATTTPAITLTTTVTGILEGNGTAISAASTTGSGAVVLANSPTFVDDITVGTAATATGQILLKGTTSGTVTLSVADAAGTWTMKLPTTDGDSGQFLQTDGSGNTTWAAGSSGITIGTTTITSGTTTRILYDNAGVVGEYTITGTGTVVAMQTNPTLSGITMTDATNIVLDTTTGTKIGTATSQKLSFYNATPIVQPSGDVATALSNLGLIATPTVVATTISTATESSDTTCFPVFVTASGTQTLPAKTNTTLTYNASTSSLGATLITATTSVTSASILASSNDSGALGASGTAFSDLFLASGGVINWDTGDVTLTHSSNLLTIAGGDLTVPTLNATTSVVLDNGDTGSGATLICESVPGSSTITFPNTTGTVTLIAATQTLTNKTLTAPNIGGAAQLAEGASIALDAALSADGAYSGITIAGTAGTTLAFGDLVYLAAADSRWELADADSATTSDRLLGMCVLAAASDGSATRLLLMGNIRADAAFPTMTIGSAMYVGETAGDIQVAIPTGADNVIRRVGYALTADELYFNPSMDSQTTVA